MASPYKTNLTVGGSPFDKSKLQMRRPTPDSDVLASSDDDHEQFIILHMYVGANQEA